MKEGSDDPPNKEPHAAPGSDPERIGLAGQEAESTAEAEGEEKSSQEIDNGIRLQASIGENTSEKVSTEDSNDNGPDHADQNTQTFLNEPPTSVQSSPDDLGTHSHSPNTKGCDPSSNESAGMRKKPPPPAQKEASNEMKLQPFFQKKPAPSYAEHFPDDLETFSSTTRAAAHPEPPTSLQKRPPNANTRRAAKLREMEQQPARVSPAVASKVPELASPPGEPPHPDDHFNDTCAADPGDHMFAALQDGASRPDSIQRNVSNQSTASKGPRAAAAGPQQGGDKLAATATRDSPNCRDIVPPEVRPGAFLSEGPALGSPRLGRNRRPGELWDSQYQVSDTAMPETPEQPAEQPSEVSVSNHDEITATLVPSPVEIDQVVEVQEAEVVPEDKHRKMRRFVAVIVLCGAVAVCIVLGVLLKSRNENSSDEEPEAPTGSPTLRPTEALPPTLQRVLERNVLRCAVSKNVTGMTVVDFETQEAEGYLVDWCRAIAAAVLGDKDLVEFIDHKGDRFGVVARREADVLSFLNTHTMQRQLLEPSTGMGFSFSTPYMYDGLRIAGPRQYVDCAEALSVSGSCELLSICTFTGSTHFALLSELLPTRVLEPVPVGTPLAIPLVEGKCKVIAGESYATAEVLARQNGYSDDDYVVGNRLFSKEPLALTTRWDDPFWSDIVNWIVHSLIAAEAQGITQETADRFPRSEFFGDALADMFQRAVAAVGNYGEHYDRHLKDIIPRTEVNSINANNDTGLVYALPFGDTGAEGPDPGEASTLAVISERGVIRCGLFNHPDPSSWLGTVLCRALSAALFDSDGDLVDFSSYNETEEIALALSEGTVDVVADMRVDIAADVLGAGSGRGFSFSKPYLYGPLDVGTFHLSSDEAIAMATRQDDHPFSSFVYWVVSAAFYAEEQGLSQDSSSNQMPDVNLFGPERERMFQDAVLEVGNYGDMYRRTVGQQVPRAGHNLLHINASGPLLFPRSFH